MFLYCGLWVYSRVGSCVTAGHGIYPRFFGSFFVYPYWQPYILLHVGGAVFEVCTFVLSFELIIILVMFCSSSPLPHAVGLAC